MIEVPTLIREQELKPGYAKENDAGADLKSPSDVVIHPGERVLIGTGINIQLPENCFAMVVPRSGLAIKHGITIPNSPGIIDAGYRGEVGVSLLNQGQEPFQIKRGDRIAQLIIVPFIQALFVEVDALEESDRGTGGFGSTGRH